MIGRVNCGVKNMGIMGVELEGREEKVDAALEGGVVEDVALEVGVGVDTMPSNINDCNTINGGQFKPRTINTSTLCKQHRPVAHQDGNCYN